MAGCAERGEGAVRGSPQSTGDFSILGNVLFLKCIGRYILGFYIILL